LQEIRYQKGPVLWGREKKPWNRVKGGRIKLTQKACCFRRAREVPQLKGGGGGRVIEGTVGERTRRQNPERASYGRMILRIKGGPFGGKKKKTGRPGNLPS